MRREGDNIIIPVKAVVAIVGALLSGGGIGAYGVTQAAASDQQAIKMQLGEIKHELCEFKNDFYISQRMPVRNCGQ